MLRCVMCYAWFYLSYREFKTLKSGNYLPSVMQQAAEILL